MGRLSHAHRALTTGVLGGGGGLTPLQQAVSYLQSLGALLIYDGTLNGSKLANKGTIGSAVDGTLTAVTIDANGMNFDGDTSLLTTPQNATLTGMTDQEWIIVARATDGGEGGTGIFFRWGFGANRGVFTASGSLIQFVMDYATDASTIIAAPSVAERVYYFTHNATTRIPTILLGEGGTVSTPSQTPSAGVAPLVAPSTDLHFGNNVIASAGWNGYMKLIAIMGRQLTSGERTTLAGFLA